MDFTDASPSKQTGISVMYLSNGAYDEQIKAESPWTGSSVGNGAAKCIGPAGR